MIEQYYNLKFIGFDISFQAAYGNCVMNETDFEAYKSEVLNFFSQPNECYRFYLGNGHMMKYINGEAFWKDMEVTRLTHESALYLKSLGLDNFGSFPNIEIFIKEET